MEILSLPLVILRDIVAFKAYLLTVRCASPSTVNWRLSP